MNQETVLAIHGGAPTAVLNATLHGIVTGAKEHRWRLLGAIGGTGGALQGDFIELSALGEHITAALPHTPGTLIGSSRTPLTDADLDRLVAVCHQHGITAVLFGGGNGTMDTCARFHTASERARAGGAGPIRVIGVPKTIDNDLSGTDHAPGFGSAARYVAGTTAEIVADVRALPIHVCVIEVMGRNAGWLAAASSLAATVGHGPDLIYLPERPFDQAEFLIAVRQIHEQKGHAVVVASEGLVDASGTPIVEPIFATGRSVYYGDVGAHLAQLVVANLGIKARNEKPGIAGRASMAWQSETDRTEAQQVGRAAIAALADGLDGVMVALQREAGPGYSCRVELVDLERLRLAEKTLPDAYIHPSGHAVTKEYLDWLTPLVGDLPHFAELNPATPHNPLPQPDGGIS